MFEDLKAMIRDPGTFFGLSGEIALYTFPVLGLLGALVLWSLQQYEYLILSSYLIIPIILAPPAYMLARQEPGKGALASDAALKYLFASFLICFAFSLTLLYTFEVRPVIYYCVIAAMAGIILVQIIRFPESQGRVAAILLQIVLLALNVCWGITLKYYEYIGRTDILVHSYYVDSLIRLGHVTTVFFDYESFPLWHIMNAGICLAGGADFPAYKVMVIAGGLAFATLPVVIYLISIKLFREYRTALISALITILFSNLLTMAASAIPRIVAQILMVFLIYLLLSRHSKARILLILLTTIAIIMYHSVSILLIILILVVLIALQLLFARNEEPIVKIRYVVLALAMTVVYWLANGSIIVNMLISNATAATDRIRVPGALTENMPWNELFNYLQYVPAIAFVLVGVFMMLLSDKFGIRAKIFASAALLLVWLSFPGPLLMVGKLVSSFGIDRIAEYTFLILIPVAAVGIAGLFYRSGRRSKVILIGLFCIWALLSVSNDWVASDNPLVKRPFYTYYFTEQEVNGMDRLVTHATGILESDYVASRYFDASPYNNITTIMEVDIPNMTFVRSGPQDVLLVREGEHEKRELRGAILGNDKFLAEPDNQCYAYIDRNLSVWKTLKGANRVYDSAAIQAYSG